MTRIVPDDAAGRAAAIEVLERDGIVALPTDTVYGLAVRLDAPGGLERLFALKRRPPERGIVLLLADASQAAELADVEPLTSALAAAFWPGGLSLVLPIRAGANLPAALTGGAATVGLRVPDHPAPRALARAVGPLPTTSANVSGEPEAGDAAAVAAQLGPGVDLILDGGPASGGPPSTVVAVADGEARLLREGAIPAARVGAVVERQGSRFVGR